MALDPTETTLTLRHKGLVLRDVAFERNWRVFADALGQRDIYHVLGVLKVATPTAEIELEDDIYGPIARLLEALPSLARAEAVEIPFEASSEVLSVLPAEGVLRLRVTDQPDLEVEPRSLLRGLATVGQRYLTLLEDLSTMVHVSPELIERLSAAAPEAHAAARAVEQRWPVHHDGSGPSVP